MKTQLEKARLTSDVNLNKEGLVALFTARAGLRHVGRRELSYELQYDPRGHVPAKRTYAQHAYNFWWEHPYDEPFSGVNHLELKKDLTKVLCPIEGKSLIDYIKEDIRDWALIHVGRRNGLYVSTHEFSEVYDLRYSVRARLANTALLLEISYV